MISSIARFLSLMALSLFMALFLSRSAFAMTVVLDPGHGGYGTAGSGAIYPPFIEKELNMSVASLVKEELEAEGITVYLTRDGDMALGLNDRAEYAASMGADLFISLHFNSSGPHDKAGCEVWASMYDPYHEIGRDVGDSILFELSKLGFSDKGVKTKQGLSGDYYGIIRHGTSYGMPSIIVEHCFIDNPYDRAVLDNVGLAALAHADATGIINYVRQTDVFPSVSHNSAKDTEVTLPSESHSIFDSKLFKVFSKDKADDKVSVSHKVENR
jgi:N-acetylmuramoyl-L-alanine amidase